MAFVFNTGSEAAVPAAVLVVALAFFPALLRMSYEVRHAAGGARGWRDRAFARFRPAGLFAWTFAWFKLRLDSMFRELPEILKSSPATGRVLDIGCGHGVAGCASLEWFPTAHVLGIDPDPTRVRAARLAFAGRGSATVGAAPDFTLPDAAATFDVILVLDVIHFISDEALNTTLERIRGMLMPGGRLILRAIVPAPEGQSVSWRFAALRRRFSGLRVAHRSADTIGRAIEKAGMEVLRSENSGGNPELVWFIAALPTKTSAAQ